MHAPCNTCSILRVVLTSTCCAFFDHLVQGPLRVTRTTRPSRPSRISFQHFLSTQFFLRSMRCFVKQLCFVTLTQFARGLVEQKKWRKDKHCTELVFRVDTPCWLHQLLSGSRLRTVKEWGRARRAEARLLRMLVRDALVLASRLARSDINHSSS